MEKLYFIKSIGKRDSWHHKNKELSGHVIRANPDNVGTKYPGALSGPVKIMGDYFCFHQAFVTPLQQNNAF